MRLCSLCRKKFQRGEGHLFSVPLDDQTREKWMANCDVFLKKNATICSDHFSPSSIRNVGNRKSLLPNALPKKLSEHRREESQQDELSGDEAEDEVEGSFHAHFENTEFIDMGSSYLGRPIYAILQKQKPKVHCENKGTQTETKRKTGGTQTCPTSDTAEDIEKTLKLLEAENKRLKSELSEANKLINEQRKYLCDSSNGLDSHIEWLE